MREMTIWHSTSIVISSCEARHQFRVAAELAADELFG